MNSNNVNGIHRDVRHSIVSEAPVEVAPEPDSQTTTTTATTTQNNHPHFAHLPQANASQNHFSTWVLPLIPAEAQERIHRRLHPDTNGAIVLQRAQDWNTDDLHSVSAVIQALEASGVQLCDISRDASRIYLLRKTLPKNIDWNNLEIRNNPKAYALISDTTDPEPARGFRNGREHYALAGGLKYAGRPNRYQADDGGVEYAHLVTGGTNFLVSQRPDAENRYGAEGHVSIRCNLAEALAAGVDIHMDVGSSVHPNAVIVVTQQNRGLPIEAIHSD